MLGTITVVGIVVILVLAWFLMRERTQDQLGAKLEKRRISSAVVGRAEYVEGMEHIPVAIALADGVFYYENGEFEASLEMDRIDEVEYTHELSTGREVVGGMGVLRLRSHGTAFDFVMKNDDCERWKQQLPPRFGGRSAQAS